MTKESVLEVHRRVFYNGLLRQDWVALAALYAEDYMLVRSNGARLTKQEVLADLKLSGLVFRSIELVDEEVRLFGSVAILTGESRTISERAGLRSEAHFRLIAVYVELSGVIRLLNVQSTEIPANGMTSLATQR